jgi:hypothetical protein
VSGDIPLPNFDFVPFDYMPSMRRPDRDAVAEFIATVLTTDNLVKLWREAVRDGDRESAAAAMRLVTRADPELAARLAAGPY